jgi:FkbM family methyltransferase
VGRAGVSLAVKSDDVTLGLRLRRLARHFGLEVTRYRPAGGRRNALLTKHGIETVLDVGANQGQYGLELRQFGYRGKLISFEPLSEAFELLAATARSDPRWECHRMALGDAETTATIGVASNLASSSLLPMLEAHHDAAPGVSMTGSEEVEVRTLDSLELDLTGPTLLKLDVQGYEDRVLRGAGTLLSDVALIECEVSLEPLYESQLTFLPMLDLLRDSGFQVLRLEPGIRDNGGRGAIVQYDAIAARA